MNLNPFQFQFSTSSAVRKNSSCTQAGEELSIWVESITADEIDSDADEYWLHEHRSNARFDSPYYHPEFTRAVSAIRDDVEIAVIRDSKNRIIGMFPFQRCSKYSADPIGGRMNDFHGLMQSSKTQIDMIRVLQALNIKRFGFHALSNGSDDFESFVFEKPASYFIDLSGGYVKYHEWARENSKTIKRMPQKIRSLSRIVGPVSFDFESNSDIILEQLLSLKKAKYRRTNTFDILSVDWAANLIREVFRRNRDGFRGILSALWAGESLVACHFGMISGAVLHYWFPIYDPIYAKYSPGLQLLMQTCRVAPMSGIKRIDLSYGRSAFKDKFSNGQQNVLFGSIDFNPLTYFISKRRYFLRKQLKQMPMKENAKVILRKVFPSYGNWHFR